MLGVDKEVKYVYTPTFCSLSKKSGQWHFPPNWEGNEVAAQGAGHWEGRGLVTAPALVQTSGAAEGAVEGGGPAVEVRDERAVGVGEVHRGPPRFPSLGPEGVHARVLGEGQRGGSASASASGVGRCEAGGRRRGGRSRVHA